MENVILKNVVTKEEFSNDFKNLLMYALSEYSLHIIKQFYQLNSVQIIDMLEHLSQNKYPTNMVIEVIDWIKSNVHYPGEPDIIKEIFNEI